MQKSILIERYSLHVYQKEYLRIDFCCRSFRGSCPRANVCSFHCIIYNYPSNLINQSASNRRDFKVLSIQIDGLN